jgi:hypothetical protein
MHSNKGYASFHALVIMVFATMAGAYLLRSASKDAGSAGSYFQMRSAATSAEAGLAAGLSQLQTDTTIAMNILDDYLRDNRNQWMLGAAGATRSANAMSFFGTGQNYTTRILGFDANTGLIKIEAQGSGPGGSAGRVTGIFRLDGLKIPMPGANSLHALYVAGDGRVAAAALVVTGPTYFGGGVRLAGSGNDFNGTFKAAASGVNPVDVQAATTFRGDAYFETPVSIRSTAVFQGGLGFDDDAALNATARMGGAGKTAFVNGLLTGSQPLDAGGNAFVYSGFANPAKVINAASRTKRESGLDVPGSLGMTPGVEDGVAFDLSVAASHVQTLDGVGLGASATGADLTACYHRFHNTDRFGPEGQWMVVDVNRPFALVRSGVPADDECYKWFIWVVHSTLTVNGSLPTFVEAPVTTFTYKHPLQIFYVRSGGSIVGFGGPGRVRAYVNVEGTGSVTYQWGPGGYLEGAIHHVSAASGFGLVGPNPMRVAFDQEVIDHTALLGFINSSATAPAAPGTNPLLTDAKLRPKLIGLYY